MPAAVAMAAIDGTGALWTFDGNPAAPQPWHPADWDVTVHSRDTQTWQQLEPMDAHHGPDCSAPPNTHPNSSYEGAVFLCRDHVMTAMNAGGYGLIYLTPPAMADWTSGESIIRVDMSTLRTSPRDWVDLWVTPYDDTLQLALDDWLPDGNGLPRRAIHIRMDNGNSGSIFRVELIDNFALVNAYEQFSMGLEYEFAQRGIQTSASRRDTFELRLRQGHLAFGMPQYGITFADADVPGLTWTRGVVTFGHHSYNPTKDCLPDANVGRTCQADTWHWDNVSITPALPFTIIRPDRREVGGPSTSGTFTLAAPAPPGAILRFMGIGNSLQVSYDGGASWLGAVAQAHSKPDQGEIFVSYRMPIPQGTTRVMVRGQSWFAGPWVARDLSVWAPSAQEVPPSTSPTPQLVATTTPSIPRASSTATPTTTPTPSAIPASPVPTSTSTSTVASSPTPSSTFMPTPTATRPSTPAVSPPSSATPMAPTPTPPAVATVVCQIAENVLTCVLPT